MLFFHEWVLGMWVLNLIWRVYLNHSVATSNVGAQSHVISGPQWQSPSSNNATNPVVDCMIM